MVHAMKGRRDRQNMLFVCESVGGSVIMVCVRVLEEMGIVTLKADPFSRLM